MAKSHQALAIEFSLFAPLPLKTLVRLACSAIAAGLSWRAVINGI